MPWYLFKRGYWEIAVDGLNKRDALNHIKSHAPGATFQCEFVPPSMRNPSQATAMVTASRQDEIHEAIENEILEWTMAGRPGAWWE